MDKKRIRFIINPISGTHSKETIVKLIPEQLNPNQFEYDIVYTERSGHAAELTKEAVANNIDIVVAVGGDGTVNEVSFHVAAATDLPVI